MYKYFLFNLIFILSSYSFLSQEAMKNQTDNYGRKQGYWKKYDEMGYIHYEGYFVDDIPVGEFKYYYPNGNIKAILIMYNNGKESHAKLFHHNQKIMAEGKYVNHKKDSIWNYYSEHDGILLSTEVYLNSVKEGVWKNYYPNKIVAEEIHYKNDVKHGPWKQYYTDGTLKLHGKYVNDQKNNDFLIYFLNGQIEMKGSYYNGLKNGIWLHFDSIGKKLEEEIFEMGKLISEQKY